MTAKYGNKKIPAVRPGNRLFGKLGEGEGCAFGVAVAGIDAGAQIGSGLVTVLRTLRFGEQEVGMNIGSGEIVGIHVYQIPLSVVKLDIIPGVASDVFGVSGHADGFDAEFFAQNLEGAGIALAHGLIGVSGDDGAESGVRAEKHLSP